MDTNILEILAKAVTPSLLGTEVDDNKSSMLKQLYSVFLARLTDDNTANKVVSNYKKLTANGSISANEVSPDSISSLASLLWQDQEQSNSVVKNLATDHSVNQNIVDTLTASALPLVLDQVQKLAGDTPVAKYLNDLTADNETSFLKDIPSWAFAIFPAGLSLTSNKATSEIKPAYASTSITETTNDNSKRGWLKILLPLIGFLIISALAWAMLKGCTEKTNETVATTHNTADEETTTEGQINQSKINLSVDDSGMLAAATGMAANQGLVDTMTNSIYGVFGDKAQALTKFDIKEGLEPLIPAANKMDDILSALKSVPNSTAMIVDQDIHINAPDAKARDTLVSKLQGLLPDFNIKTDESLKLTSVTGDNATKTDVATKNTASTVEGNSKSGVNTAKNSTLKIDNDDDIKKAVTALNGQALYFSTNANGISAKNQKILSDVANLMTQVPKSKLTITGHTDSSGDSAYNQKLSEQRAQSVKAHLVNKAVAADRISIIGAGETQPVAENNTEEGRYNNRRISFDIKE